MLLLFSLEGSSLVLGILVLAGASPIIWAVGLLRIALAVAFSARTNVMGYKPESQAAAAVAGAIPGVSLGFAVYLLTR